MLLDWVVMLSSSKHLRSYKQQNKATSDLLRRISVLHILCTNAMLQWTYIFSLFIPVVNSHSSLQYLSLYVPMALTRRPSSFTPHLYSTHSTYQSSLLCANKRIMCAACNWATSVYISCSNNILKKKKKRNSM